MDNVWEEIKSRLSLEDVIQDYIKVQNTGLGFRAVCPFHREKTPSLMISPDKGVWHCFGCGAGGDMFAFVTLIENCTKKEALEKLASKAGVSLDKYSSPTVTKVDSGETKVEVDEYTQGLKILTWVEEVYHKILLKLMANREHEITRYLILRGLTQKTVEQFKIGYAPKDNFLLKLSQKHNLNLDLMYQVGVFKDLNSGQTSNIIRSQDKKFKDKFSDRMVIPIKNLKSQTVGFTGRVLPYDKSERPRYLNSSQSAWFNKSELWFGLDKAKKSILQEKKALVVEGNMDVIACFQNGVENAVASQGTSFTLEQLKLLKKQTKTVWLAFDNDEAGRVSGRKFYLQASKLGLEVFKVFIDQKYKDLDEYFQNESSLILSAEPYLSSRIKLLEQALSSSDTSIQKTAILDILECIEVLDQLSQEQYLQKLSKITLVSVPTLQNLLKSIPVESINSELEELSESAVSVEQTMSLAFQNLVAQNLPLNPEKQLVLDKLFFLLREILPDFREYSTFENYLSSLESVFEMIKNQEHFSLDSELQRWQTLHRFLDTKVGQFSLNSELMEAYLEVKKYNW